MINTLIQNETRSLEYLLPHRNHRFIPDGLRGIFIAIYTIERANNLDNIRYLYIRNNINEMAKNPNDFTQHFKASILLSAFAWLPTRQQRINLWNAFLTYNFYWRPEDELNGILRQVALDLA